MWIIPKVPKSTGSGTVSEKKKTYGSLKPNGGKKHERYFNEAAFRSRCSLWTSDKKMEP